MRCEALTELRNYQNYMEKTSKVTPLPILVERGEEVFNFRTRDALAAPLQTLRGRGRLKE